MLSFTFLCILLWTINLLKTTFDNSLTLKNKTVSTPSMQLVLVSKSSRVEALRWELIPPPNKFLNTMLSDVRVSYN